MGPLAGFRVLDLSRVLAAPWASQMLGDLGAEIIKVEMPGRGDDSRLYGPAWLPDAEGKPGNNSSFYLCANRNKRSITIDFSKPEGRDVVLDLARTCDVLLENFIAGATTRAGLDYASVKAVNPRIVYCSVTGYGQDGPSSSRPGYDAVFQAQSGLMAVTGLPDDEPGGGPMRIGPSLVDVSTGYNAAIGILAALLGRDRTGEGQHIDVALLDVAVAMQSHLMQGYLLDGETPARKGTLGNGGHPARVFRCADGDIYISIGTSKQYEGFCAIIEAPQLANDPRFATGALRYDNRAAWDAIAGPLIEGWGKQALYEALVAARVPCSVINDYDGMFADPQVVHRELRRTIPHPQSPGRGIDIVANPLRFSTTPIDRYATPPMLGQHTDDILADIPAYPPERIALLREQGVI